jgi:hypothetical protein
LVAASIGLCGGEEGKLELRDRRYILTTWPRSGLTFLVLVLSMTWFDLFTGGLVLAVICGIAAVIVWQTRKETGDEAH